jgi:glycosyltransferase involved in cell wall biosynthesis
MKKKPRINIIQSTHASLNGLQSAGLLERHIYLLNEYSKYFDVILYSCDHNNYSKKIGVIHKIPFWLPKSFGYRHFVYYLWLVFKAPQMKGFIKVFGSNIPTLPIIKLLSRQKMMVTYQWDYEKQTLENYKKGLKSWLPPILEKLAIMPADIVLVTTQWLKDKIENKYYKKTILLPNWVDFNKLKIIENKHYLKEKNIIFAGRLHWSKGVDTLIDAFSRLSHYYSDLKLIICGDGEEKSIFEEKVYLNKLKRIEFKGVISNKNVLDLLSCSQIFILPTLTMEGHPKSLIEAMAAKCICLASNVPGNRELMIDAGCKENLFAPGDVDSLVSKIIWALKNNNSDKTYSYAKKNFSANVIIKKDITILKEFIERDHSRIFLKQ